MFFANGIYWQLQHSKLSTLTLISVYSPLGDGINSTEDATIFVSIQQTQQYNEEKNLRALEFRCLFVKGKFATESVKSNLLVNFLARNKAKSGTNAFVFLSRFSELFGEFLRFLCFNVGSAQKFYLLWTMSSIESIMHAKKIILALPKTLPESGKNFTQMLSIHFQLQ